MVLLVAKGLGVLPEVDLEGVLALRGKGLVDPITGIIEEADLAEVLSKDEEKDPKDTPVSPSPVCQCRALFLC